MERLEFDPLFRGMAVKPLVIMLGFVLLGEVRPDAHGVGIAAPMIAAVIDSWNRTRDRAARESGAVEKWAPALAVPRWPCARATSTRRTP